jgi:DNA (cytosine-5)-methyltransferase 1
MRYGSMFSGIEAASAAWRPLGWECAWLAEVDPFCLAVLAHHYPDVVQLGDVMGTSFYFSPRNRAWYEALDFESRLCGMGVDLIVGGSPCQAFSVAGLRRGLGDERGNLTLRFVEICNHADPAWIVWENVPGVFSDKTNAFGCLLAGIVGEDAPLVPGRGGWTHAGLAVGPKRSAAWRVLDAQYFGLAQRRARVFVVARRADNGERAGAVLFEPGCLPRHFAPGRETGTDVANAVTGRLGGGGPDDNKAQGGHLIPILEAGKRCGTGADKRDGLGIGPDGGPMFTLQAGAQHAVAGPMSSCSGTGRKHGFGWGQQDWENGYVQPVTGPLQSGGTPKGHGTAGVNDQAVESGHLIVNARQDPVTSELAQPLDRLGNSQAVVFEPRYVRNGRGGPSETAPPLKAQSGHTGKGDGAACVAFDTTQITHAENRSNPQPGDPAPTLASKGPAPALARALTGHHDRQDGTVDTFAVQRGMTVRRLTPEECERLQGFPDGYTHLKYGRPQHPGQLCPDGPRYRALGNSMAVNVMAWIGRRIQEVEAA